MNSQDDCLCCLSKCNNGTALSATTIGDESLIKIVNLHFDFKFNTEMNGNSLCAKCLLKIRNFHEFYLEIKWIHCKEYRELDIKIESESMAKELRDSDSRLIELESQNVRFALERTADSEFIPEENINPSKVAIRKPSHDQEPIDPIKKKRNSQIASKYGPYYLDENIDKLQRYFAMKCDLCEMNFINWDEARDHYKIIHNKKGYLMCCGRKFSVYGRIIEHLIWHDHPNSFRCTDCDKSFLDGTCLRKHKNDVHSTGKRNYKCDQCLREYPRLGTLNLHVRTAHSKEKRQFECHKCGQKFGQESSVRQHLKIVHDRSDSRVCDICAKYFKSSTAYNIHCKVVHATGPTKVQCIICQTWLKHEYLLRIHMRVHQPQQPQICKYCGKESPSIRASRDHIKRNHLNTKTFPCHICKKSFSKPKTLKEHVAIHTGDTSLYTCSFCPRTFRSSGNMYSHRKRDHPIEYQNAKSLGINYENVNQR